MSLRDYFVPCMLMDKVSTSDGFGGVTVRYRDGAEFKAGISTDSSTEAQIAYQNGLKVMYSIVTTDLVQLHQGDIVRRLSDGVTMRVTSEPGNMHTPSVATEQYYKVTAEAVSV